MVGEYNVYDDIWTHAERMMLELDIRLDDAIRDRDYARGERIADMMTALVHLKDAVEPGVSEGVNDDDDDDDDDNEGEEEDAGQA
jgi:hypothetical protein